MSWDRWTLWRKRCISAYWDKSFIPCPEKESRKGREGEREGEKRISKCMTGNPVPVKYWLDFILFFKILKCSNSHFWCWETFLC